MSDEILTINDIVEKRAAEIKEQKTSEAQKSQEKEKEQVVKKEPDPPSGDSGSGAEGAGGDKVENLLKEFNVTSVEELRKKLNQPASPATPKEKTAEEKEKEEELNSANLQSFAVENGIMKLGDFEKRSSVQKKQDVELVKDKFESEYKESNPDATLQEIKDAFELKYNLESDNPALNKWAEKRIKEEAESIRKPLESSYSAAKSKFEEQTSIRKNYPEYSKQVSEAVTGSVPKKLEVYSGKVENEDVKVELEITDKDRDTIIADVTKRLHNTSTYALFKDNKTEDMKALIAKEVNLEIWGRLRDQAIAKVAEDLRQYGARKRSSATGAETSFAIKQTNEQRKEGTKTMQDKEKEILNSLRGVQEE